MRSYASPAPYCQREALHRSGTDCPSGVRPPRQQLRIALRGQIRHSDVLPYHRGHCTQYCWAAMGLRHLSWMISTVHDESRTIPPRRRCAQPTSRFTAAKSAPAGATGHPGQHRAGGASRGDGRDTRDQAARRGIRRNWAGSSRGPRSSRQGGRHSQMIRCRGQRRIRRGSRREHARGPSRRWPRS